MIQLDITKQNVAVEKALEQTTKPRHNTCCRATCGTATWSPPGDQGKSWNRS